MVFVFEVDHSGMKLKKLGAEAFQSACLSVQVCFQGIHFCRFYLEGQRDLVSKLITPIAQIYSLIRIIDLLDYEAPLTLPVGLQRAYTSRSARQITIRVVVKIMVPFWVPSILDAVL